MIDSISTFLAVLGLLMAITELYFPELSLRLERLFDCVALRLRPVYRVIGKAPQKSRAWLLNTPIGQYYSHWHYWLCIFVAVPIGFVFVLIDEQMQLVPALFRDDFFELARVGLAIVLGAPFFLLALISIPHMVAIAGYPVYFCISMVLSTILFLLAKLMWLANFLGKGKGVSGVGLMMALYEVLTGV